MHYPYALVLLAAPHSLLQLSMLRPPAMNCLLQLSCATAIDWATYLMRVADVYVPLLVVFMFIHSLYICCGMAERCYHKSYVAGQLFRQEALSLEPGDLTGLGIQIHRLIMHATDAPSSMCTGGDS